MTVLRIVPDFFAKDPAQTKAFYQTLLGLDVVMDQQWIITFASDANARPQISIASEGGSGTPVPDVSIEVDNVNEIYANAKAAGFKVTYNLCDEVWGVRRFFVQDPTGKVINILQHI